VTASQPCRACGADATGFVCLYCGAPLLPATSAAEERQALEELHQAMVHAKEDSQRARILANGSLPDDDRVLTDAGLRAAALLDPERYADDTPSAAIARIEAIRAKLRMRGQLVADRELGARIDAYRKGAERETGVGLRASLAFAAFAIALIVGIVVAVKRC
jgi:hypothetical protein